VTSKDDVLRFIADEGRADAAAVARRFELSAEAATKHLERLHRNRLIEPAQAGHPARVPFTLAPSGTRRLKYLRDGNPDVIEFR
jgi:predicted ArsR family transcriptional regulator